MKRITLLCMLFIACCSWQTHAQTYCPADAGTITVEPITSVVFAGIDNTTSATSTNGYEDYTGMTANVVAGGSQDITLQGFTGGDYINFFTVFIDWNQNGILDDAGEMYEIGSITNSSGEDGIEVSGPIASPGNALAGNTRMRVIKNFNSSPTDPCGSYSWAQAEDYTVNVTIPACPAPFDLTATNVTATSADLGWSDAGLTTTWDVELIEAGTGPTGNPTDTGVANPFSVSGLTSATNYEFYVRAVCDGGDISPWAGPFAFTTECSISVAPYTMDFETSMTDTPNCWSISSSESNGWEFDDGPSSSNNYSDHTTGSGYLAFVDASSTFTPDATMTTGLIDVSALTTPMLEFYVYHFDADDPPTSDSNSLTVEVYDGAAWNQVYFDDNGDVDAWEKVQIDLSTLTITGDIQARFIVDATVGGNFYNDIGIDDVSFDELPTCMEPSDLMVDAVAVTTADISWTMGGAETEWEVVYGATGFDPETEGTTVSATTNPETTLSGLDAATNYEFYVKAVCGAGDESVWAGPVAFTTACGTFMAPYTMDFETSMTDTPNCWSISSSESNGWEFDDGPSSSNNYSDHTTGSGYLAFVDASSAFTPDATMTTGLIDVSALTTPMLEFYVYHFDADDPPASDSNSLTVEVYDGAAWNQVYFDDNGDVDAWEKVQIDLSTLTITGDIQARFIVDATLGGNFYNDIGIDDISFDELPTCMEPSDLMVDAVAITTADISWTMGGAETEWEVVYGATGFDPETEGTTVSATTNPETTLSGLDAQTTYEFYVKAVCGAGDESVWAGPIAFTTACDTFGDFTEYFDTTNTDEVPNCWSTLKENSTSSFVTVDVGSNSSAPSAPNDFQFYNSGDGSAELYLISPILDNLTDADHWLRFYYEGDDDVVLTVGTMSDPNDALTFTAIESLSTSTSYEEYIVTFDQSYADAHIAFKASFSATYNTVNLDNVIWEPIPTCLAPSDLMVDAATTTTVDISWLEGDAETAWNISWGAPGYVPGDADEIGTDNATSPNYQVTGLTAETDYDVYVQADCGAGDISTWRGPLAIYTGHCIPTGSGNNSDEILNFTLGDLSNDSATSEGTDGYSDYSDTVAPVDLEVGVSYVASLTSGGGFGDHGAAIWIDYNDNLIFEPSEMVAFLSEEIGANSTVDFPGFIPQDSEGTHRLRVQYHYDVSGDLLDPCASTSQYAETEDYMVNILPVPGSGSTLAYGINNATSEFVSFDVTDPSVLTVLGTSLVITDNFENAGAIDPANPTVAYAMDDQGELYSVDIATGVYTAIGTITPPGAETWTGMAFDPVSGVLYAVSSGDTSSTLSSIDIAGMSATNIGVTGMTLPISLGIDGSGHMYGHDINDDNLYLIDKTTGVATIVGPTGFDANYGQGMAWDYNTQTMYMAAFNNGTSMPEWRSVNTFSGMTTLVGTIGDGSGQMGWVSTPGATVTAPTCEPPVMGTIANVDETSADLGWTESGTATSWDIEFGPAGFTPTGNPTDTGVSNPHPVSALTGATSYEFYVRADCGSGDTSIWSGPYQFATDCGIIDSFPFTETFEDTSGTRDCWTNEYVMEAFDWNYVNENGDATISARTGSLMAEFRNSTVESATKLISPAMDLTSLTSPQLQFYFANVNWVGDIDELRVYYKTSATGTWTQIGTDYIDEHTDWTLVILDLPNPSSEYYVAFEGTSNWGRGLNLDDVWIGETPTCPKPLNLMVDVTTDTSADFSWDAEPNASLGYEWFIYAAGADPEVDTPVDSGTTPAGTTTASSTVLTAMTMYDLYVVADCDADGLSELAGPLSFETAVAPPICGGIFYDAGGPDGDYDMNANSTTVIMPETAGDVVTVTFTSFDVQGGSGSAYDALYVYDGPDDSFPLIDSGNPVTDSGFPAGGYYGTDIPGPFTSSDASGALTFVFRSDATVAQAGWEANVTCGPAPSCYAPIGLSVTEITDITADLSWGTVDGATNGYEWFVYLSGADPEVDTPISTGTTGAGVTTAQATGLTALTTYDFYVWSDCDTDGMSALAGPVSFETMIAPPVNDNLIDAIPLALNAECSGDAYTNVGATTQANEPSGTCHFGGDVAQTTVWFSFVAPASGSVIISTDFLPGELGDSQLTVFEEPTDLSDLSTLSPEVGCDEDGGIEIGLMSILELNGLTGGDTYYIQVDGYNGGEGAFCIVVNDNTCPEPTNLGINGIGEDTATVTWIPGGSETEWEVEYGPTGFAIGSGTVVTVTTDPTTDLGGLDPETTYDVYVTAICGADVSIVVGPVSFTTFAPDQCGQSQTSNGFENGLFMEEGGQWVANDFIVSSGTANFAVENITANLMSMGGIASLDVLFFQDNAGMPGAQIGATIEDVVPTSQAIIGEAFGYDVHEVVIDLPAPVNFAGSATDDITYWVQLVATPTAPGTQVAWETTSASTIGNFVMWASAGTWNPSAEGEDGVFSILGECTPLSVNDQTFEGFSYYPNPVDSQLNLKATSDIEKVEVYNLLGQVVLKTEPNSMAPILQLNNLQAGAYLMKVTIDGKVGTYRLIKE